MIRLRKRPVQQNTELRPRIGKGPGTDAGDEVGENAFPESKSLHAWKVNEKNPTNTEGKQVNLRTSQRVALVIVLAYFISSCTKLDSVGTKVQNTRSTNLEKFRPFKLQQNQMIKISNGNPSNSIGYTSLILNPAKIEIDLYSGWNRELEANKDQKAIAFISGPTFELTQRTPQGFSAHGDLKLSNGIWVSKNRAASNSRAYLCITNKRLPIFGYGSLSKANRNACKIFVGGLHSLLNKINHAPLSYKGVYGKMYMSDVRIIYGLRKDDQIEIIETDDGVSWNNLLLFVKQKGFLAAYLPDHASKSRLIVPGKRPWTLEHATWISGGRPSITQMPIMLRIKTKSEDF